MISVQYVLLISLGSFILGTAAGRQILHRQHYGEALLASVVGAQFSRPHILLNNVTLRNEAGTTQIDHVLIADTGIFIIEGKHYRGWIFGDPHRRQWTQTIYRVKTRFQNPIHQNYLHVQTVRALFNLADDFFFPLVVFTADAEFKTDLGPDVIHLHELIEYLNIERPVIIDEKKMAYIVGRIEMKRERRSLETDEYHINQVQQKIHARQQKV